MVTIDGKEMKVEKIEYLETFGQLALFDSSKKIENRENTPFTFTPKIPGQVKGSAKDPEEVHVEELPPMSTFFSDELGDDTPPAQEHSEPFTREQEVAKLNQIFNDLRQLTPLPNDADDETREERQQSMEDATNRINDFIYKRERGNIRFTSTEDINDYYLLSNVLYFDDDRLVFSATDNSDTEIDRQNMTMSIEEISDEGEVSVEGAEEVTAESLGAEWESIKGKMTSLFFTNSLLLDEGGLFSAQLDRDIATFIS